MKEAQKIIEEKIEKIREEVRNRFISEKQNVNAKKIFQLKNKVENMEDQELFRAITNKEILLDIDKTYEGMELPKKEYLALLKKANEVCKRIEKELQELKNLREEEIATLLKNKKRKNIIKKARLNILSLFRKEISFVEKQMKKTIDNAIKNELTQIENTASEIDELIISAIKQKEVLKDRFERLQELTIDSAILHDRIQLQLEISGNKPTKEILFRINKHQEILERKNVIEQEIEKLSKEVRDTAEKAEKKLEDLGIKKNVIEETDLVKEKTEEKKNILDKIIPRKLQPAFSFK